MTGKGYWGRLRNSMPVTFITWAGAFHLRHRGFNPSRIRVVQRGQGELSRWPRRLLYDRRWDWNPGAFHSVNFDLGRMRAAVEGGCREVPAGMSPEAINTWILQVGGGDA